MGRLGPVFRALIRGWRCYRVVGNSMLPTLGHGDLVWVDPKAFACDRPQKGQIVVARHPYRTNVWMVKRVVRTLDDDRFLLGGDNRQESTDSEVFGSVPTSLVIGPVVLRFRRKPAGGYRLRIPGRPAVDAGNEPLVF